MSRRAKKQHSDRAPSSGTRFSNDRANQRKKRVGRLAQESQKPKALRVVVSSDVSTSARSDLAASAERGATELAPLRAASSSLPAASPAAAHPFPDGALLEVERAFFEGASSSESAASDLLVSNSQPAMSEEESLLLTPKQQQRREWFRRKVATLMAGMGTLATVAVAVRIASLL